jgi:hypothetical protein
MRVGGQKALGVLIITLLAVVWFRPLDTFAQQHTESGLNRAFATFAAARGLNAVISVLKSGTVNFQLVGGASFQPGAVLDPVDDLVEQFSALMLAATLSFATQRLLIEVSGAWQVSVLLTVLFLAWGVFHLKNWAAPRWLPKLALALLCLRFAVPIAALGSEAIYRLLLANEYEASQAHITNAEVPDADVRASEGPVDTVKRWLAQSTEFGKNIEALKAKVDGWVRHIVTLAAVFIVQTVVLPLLFLWAMLKLYRVLSAAFLARRL